MMLLKKVPEKGDENLKCVKIVFVDYFKQLKKVPEKGDENHPFRPYLMGQLNDALKKVPEKGDENFPALVGKRRSIATN